MTGQFLLHNQDLGVDSEFSNNILSFFGQGSRIEFIARRCTKLSSAYGLESGKDCDYTCSWKNMILLKYF